MRTSISDTQDYNRVCERFVENEEAFDNFKRDPVYTGILEHTSREQALKYIDCILKSKLDLDKVEKLKENDQQGNADIQNYGNETFDGTSPSTIRYIKVLSDLINTFTDLSGRDIIEIGIGYGGQCKVINDYFDVNSYQLVDLDSVLALSKKYLSKYDYKNLTFDSKNFKDKYDLVISNYAITECDKETQIFYIDNIINKSNHGYITCNFISDIFNVDSLTKEEFISRINKKTFEYPETPQTHAKNFLLLW